MCDICHGPCRLQGWELDTPFIQNNPERQRATMIRRHKWIAPDNVAEVALVRAAIASMPTSITFPCVGCGRHSFPDPGTTCYWCKQIPVNELQPITPKLLPAVVTDSFPDPKTEDRPRSKSKKAPVERAPDLFS